MKDSQVLHVSRFEAEQMLRIAEGAEAVFQAMTQIGVRLPQDPEYGEPKSLRYVISTLKEALNDEDR